MDISNIVLAALHESEGIGWKTIERIMHHGGIRSEMLHYRAKDWEACGVGVETAHHLEHNFMLTVESVTNRMSDDDTNEPRQQCSSASNLTNDQKIRIITALDTLYPQRLHSSSQPPWVLYAIGDLQLMEMPSIAMVGTRLPTAYGKKVAAVLAEELAEAGFAVVSGMARGIDSVVHDAVLARDGRTIAVLGGGIDVVYPPENRSLYEDIADKGLILSEYPPGTKVRPGFFPRRNRIIAALALGTVVVEADARSGSLITADMALEAGRDVFSVPGQVTSPKSRGTLDLIKQGAKMVTCGADIIEEYEIWLPKGIKDSYNKERQEDHFAAGENAGLTNDELEIYHRLEQGPGSLDDLLEQTRWDFGHLHSVLLSLIIKKQITQLPGAIYKII
ncbi:MULTISPECIES: DNA-processing protein DprA [Paenibacillus]|uniref:DNA-protecting protein DprA n=1 Tax=Paenibacillus campinasensis TaxID=66347 RepID=A0ABW9T1K6_9BACL|nr:MULTISPECIES: DNA-processing protein DprA [Paenibacillus]MUG66772.1 DNA-protecting protein DprA [Paenibacillus campinasensis]PAK54605.1 DNA-protecting protein DprA [Paenibacillus sp. 7541]